MFVLIDGQLINTDYIERIKLETTSGRDKESLHTIYFRSGTAVEIAENELQTIETALHRDLWQNFQ